MDNASKEYEDLKQELKRNLKAKEELEDEFDRLQQEIYDKETEYLLGSGGGTKGHHVGNIIKGFDGLGKSAHHGHESSNSFNNDDRLFSMSSAIFVKQQLGENATNEAYQSSSSK